MLHFFEGEHEETRSKLQPFTILKTMGLASGDPELVPLLAGEPGDDLPIEVRKAISDAVLKPKKGYPRPWGEATFMERYADHHNATYGTDLSPEDVFFAPGSSCAIEKALQFACEYGDQVLCPYPTYKGYINNAQLNGVHLIHVAMDEESGYIVTPQMIDKAVEIYPNLKGVTILDPSNPLATSMTNEQMHAVADRIAHHGLVAIVDEAYLGMVWEGERRDSFLTRPDVRSIVLNTFSKYWLAPSMRMGVLATQDPVFKEAMSTAALSTILGGPPFVQQGMVEAFNHVAYFDEVVAGNKPKAKLVEDMLVDIGMVGKDDTLGQKTRSTFYRYFPVGQYIARLSEQFDLRAKGIDLTSDHLVELAIKFSKVAMSGGSDYIPSALTPEQRREADAMRISYSTDQDTLKEGLKRAGNFFTRKMPELLETPDVLGWLRQNSPEI